MENKKSIIFERNWLKDKKREGNLKYPDGCKYILIIFKILLIRQR